MSNIDNRVLREAAVRAGGVKWQYMRATQHSKAYITDDKGSTVINCTDGDVPAKCAGFLESANPAAVLALLDELEAAEKRIAELERSETQLIDERDNAESALNDVYKAVMGQAPELSNWFSFADAIEEIELACELWRNQTEDVTQFRARIAELEARIVELPERYEVDMCPTPYPDGEWYSREDIFAALVSAGVRYAAGNGKGE
ncbi:TPA: ead/Ea22-like family protein [Enterobacter hormaechei]|nr:ead/Ea22-like family protein [Enterobacter hormaechei]